MGVVGLRDELERERGRGYGVVRGAGDKVLAPASRSSSSGESYACTSVSLSGVVGADGGANAWMEWVGSMGEGGETMVAGGWRVSEGARVDAAPGGWAGCRGGVGDGEEGMLEG